MPEIKYEYYAALAERTARQLTDSLENWTAFLDTAARLYKYPYHEQLMIYAQRPDATACADYNTWSKTMRRYIRRGTKGIALIDHNSDTPKLKYVYDLADTGTRQNSRPVNLWQMEQEHLDSVFYMLDQNYGVADISLTNIFEEISANLADEFWDNHRRDIIGIVENSFLENQFTHEDFLPVFEFNTPDTIAVLGTAVSEISEQILRDIEITIKIYEKERTQEHEERSDLHENGRLLVPEPDPAEPAGTDIGQIWEDAPGVFKEPPSDPVQSADSLGETVLSPDGDRHDSEPSNGADDGRADESERYDRTDEVGEPDAVGTDDEQSESASGRSDNERTDLQLSEPFRRGEQLSLFDDIPTEVEQIEYIDKAERVSHTPFAFSFSQDEIDTVLRFGSNERDSRMRIAAEFMKDKSVEVHADFLKNLFHGGNGFKVDSREICAWYADNGIHLAQGRSARYVQFAGVIPWTEAAEHIGELLERGHYASNVEISEAQRNEQELLTNSLLNLHSEFTEESRNRYFSDAMFEGTFPQALERITDMLADPSMRDAITDEMARFVDDYTKNRDLLRFHYPKPVEMLPRLRELSDMTREFNSDMAEMPPVEQFITEDEINESFTDHGSGVSGGKNRIYEYLIADHTQKEKVNFLKNEYGIGGHSHALSGATHSDEWHDSKGIRLKKDGCYDVQISWQNALKRLEELIRKDRYLSQNEKDVRRALNDSERVYAPVKAEHPDDIVLYQMGQTYEIYGEDAQKAGDLLGRYVFHRDIFALGRMDMCNVNADRLDESVEKLRAQYDVTVISLENGGWKMQEYPKNEIDSQIDEQDFPETPPDTLLAEEQQETEQPQTTTEPEAIYPADENHLPYDIVIERLKTDDVVTPENFRITDDNLGTGGAKTKFRMNMDAIHTLKQIESENRHATPEEQEILSKYVGWGGLADAFDDSKDNWKSEYTELSAALTPDEYAAARSSTLNAHYTTPTVIKAIYEAVGNMGFTTGNVLEPAMGVGNFFGLLPEEMSGSKLYGVELDSITGRIAKQLYPNADITVAGFETTDRRDFYDLAIGNVPFGQCQVNDRAYNKLNFSIHDYFFGATRS